MAEASSAKAAVSRAQPGERPAAENAAMTASQRAEEMLGAVPEELRAYGVTVCGAALGDDAYIEDFLRSKQIELCGIIGSSSPGTIISVTSTLANASAHAASTAIYYSLQCRVDYLLETHLPVHTLQLRKAVDQALRQAYNIAFDIDLLDPDGLVPGQDDPSFLSDLAGLKTSAGGCGYRRTEERAVFLNALNSALPQLMGNESEPGLWPSLAPILGAKSFHKENEDQRWKTFFESGSAWADALKGEIVRVQNLRSDALKAADKDASPPESKVFDTTIEAFGKGIKKKLQAQIMDEIRALRAEGLRIRASKLLANDQRRLAFEQSHTDKCSNSLFTSTPNKLTPFTNIQFHTAVQNAIGAPLSLLKNLTDFTINNTAFGAPQRVDPYGNNLKKLSNSEGDGFRMNHDAFVNILSSWLARASIPHKGGWRGKPKSCKGEFTHVAHRLNIGNGVGDGDSEKVLNKIIPDLIIDGRALLCLFDGIGVRLFSGCKTLVDVKTKTCDAKYPPAEGKVAAVVDKRAREANKKYFTRARKLDAELGTPAETEGPFEKELRSYGKEGRVIIPVVGAFGEMSSDVYAIIDLVASVLTHEHLSYYSEHPAAIKGMFQQSMYKSFGLTAHLGWARLVIDRMRDQVKYSDASQLKYSGAMGNNEDEEAQEYENHFNPDRGFAETGEAAHTHSALR